MRNYAQKSAESSQDPAKNTGKKTICQDLTFDQAAELLNEIPDALIKFSRMGALS